MGVIIIQPKFFLCYNKRETRPPWLVHQLFTLIYSVVADLVDISPKFHSKDTWTAGRLLHTKFDFVENHLLPLIVPVIEKPVKLNSEKAQLKW